MKIAIGTTSEIKIRALKRALERFDSLKGSEIISVKTDSGVPAQPFGYAEMADGARNRSKQAKEKGD